MKKVFLKWAGVLGLVLILTTTVGAAAPGNSEYTPVQKSDNLKTVFIQSLEMKNGEMKLVVDPIQWYEGEEAHEIFRKLEGDPEMMEAPDGYYIVNDEEEAIELTVKNNAQVLLQLYDHTGLWEDAQIIWNQEVTLNKFNSIFKNDNLIDMKWFPYHVTVEDGVVTQIIQQYIP
ncbi:hypothetical protein [Paenibacillus lemnae]|uniref:Uncharacterized protein n=1 Tax=Paenibacillus lemnae TaxID=1330551 RepID=A0A848MCL7_PAELE|nr:hypothetical protein [Paenibacillus lemnae]NMO97803.1 hypothetical protein [Paenibacillus lemnae]